MNHLQKHYNHIIMYDLITKFNFNNIFQILNIKKITLNIGLKNSNVEKKKMIAIILLLKLITNQQIFCTKSKKNNIIFKIKKGAIMGCKVTLRKKNIYFFLEKLIIFIIPNIKNFNGIDFNNKNSILNFQISNLLNFFELENEFLKFQNLPPINISIYTNNNSYKKVLVLFNQLNLLIKSENNSIGRV